MNAPSTVLIPDPDRRPQDWESVVELGGLVTGGCRLRVLRDIRGDVLLEVALALEDRSPHRTTQVVELLEVPGDGRQELLLLLVGDAG